ncbi:MAG: tetratricopeptide repeat protein [bacterium]
MKHIFMFLLSAVILIGCGGKSEEELLKNATNLVKNKKLVEAVAAYEELIKEYPESKNTEFALFELGKIFQSKAIKSNADDVNLKKAIMYYTRLVEQFPKSEKSPNSLFMTAFIYANELKMLDSAKIRYEEFLSKYPNNDLAISAKYELDNLGVPPEQILENLNKKSK